MEVIEARNVPAVMVELVDGVLNIVGDNTDNTVLVSVVDNQVVVKGDNETFVFDGNDVTMVTSQLNDGNDYFESFVAIPHLVEGGGDNDYIRTDVANDTLVGGDGNDILTDFGGSNVLVGNDGNDNIWGFGNDSILGGNGNDTVYSIVGVSTIDGGAGNDRIITNGVSTFVEDAEDRPAVVFKARDGNVALDNGVLYVNRSPNNDTAVIWNDDTSVYVLYNGEFSRFDKDDVTQVAGIMGAGNDKVILSASTLDSVFYGAGGNDVLLGGLGNDLLKGGGGNDVLSTGADGQDDITGDSGSDVLYHFTDGFGILHSDVDDFLVAIATNNFLTGRRR